MNPLFNALGGGQPNIMQMLQQLRQNPVQMLQQLKNNPVQFLMQRKFNLPQNIDANDPQAIINHLVQSGQVPQDAINSAYKIAQSMK